MLSSYFISLFIGTFVLEDAALLAAVALVSQNNITMNEAFWACFLGIAIGDFVLYFLGYFAHSVPYISQSKIFIKIQNKFTNLNQNLLTYAVISSRFLPGTRLVTYTLAGFVKYSFTKFFFINIGTVFLWVYLALQAGQLVKSIFSDHWLLLLAGVFVVLSICRWLFANLQSSWSRKIFKHSWRKWLHFEFWPAWLFYIPIVPYYIYFALKHRSFFLPFYADPFLENAGLIGESKWDIYKYLEQNEFGLKTIWLKCVDERFEQIRQLILDGHFKYPFILKPDIGQRGFAVRIIKTEFELKEYIDVAKFDLILQELSTLQQEAGIFYVRLPSEKKGQIFSITDKLFPTVTGDGVSNVGDLILNNPRARIIAATYFERFGSLVESIPKLGEVVLLATCGNHCQGAIFKNGEYLNSEELLAVTEKIVQQIPDFYFGRLDIRYNSAHELKQGLNFKIVEINAAGSEATHIWDQETKLIVAYKVLFSQWGFLFKIGDEVKKMKRIRYPVSLLNLIRDLYKMSLQEKKLSVSS